MFKRGVFAGTFGPLHIGHMYMIDSALEVVRYLTIGLTTDKLAQRKVEGTKQTMPSYRERVKMIDEFMVSKGFENRYEIVPVEDGINEGINYEGDIIFVSDEDSVVDRARHINTLRGLKRIPKLGIMIIPRLRYRDGKIVSSTKIREENTNEMS